MTYTQKVQFMWFILSVHHVAISIRKRKEKCSSLLIVNVIMFQLFLSFIPTGYPLIYRERLLCQVMHNMQNVPISIESIST